MFKHSPNEKGMVYGPNGKGIMASREYTLIIYSSNEKGMVYEILFFQVVIVMVKDKKRCTIKNAVSIKISAMQLQKLHYVNKSKVTSSFQGICVACIFWLLYSIHHQCQLVKGQL